MHSSRMRTVRCSGRLGGDLPRGVSSRGCVCPGEDGVCPGEDGVCPGEDGVYPGEDGVCPGLVYTSPTVDRITDACENITFPQLLLRTVNMHCIADYPKNSACFNAEAERRSITN